MTTLATFLTDLRYGELKDAYLGESGDTLGYTADNLSRIIAYTNQGLTALHSRFILIKKEVVIETIAPISIYWLREEHSKTVGTHTQKYIVDSVDDTFKGGLVKILEVYNEAGCLVPLNDDDDSTSLHTPSFESLQVPNPEFGNSYGIIYQALHDKLLNASHETQKVRLPPFLHEALGSFVVAKAMTWMGGEGPTVKGQEYMARFEAICAEVEMKDLAQTSHVKAQSKLEQRGFV